MRTSILVLVVAIGVAAVASIVGYAFFDFVWWKPATYDCGLITYQCKDVDRGVVIFVMHCLWVVSGAIAAIRLLER